MGSLQTLLFISKFTRPARSNVAVVGLIAVAVDVAVIEVHAPTVARIDLA